MGAYLHDKRCPCNDTLMLEIAVLTGTLPIQGNIEYSWYRSDGGAGAREGGKVWREKKRERSANSLRCWPRHSLPKLYLPNRERLKFLFSFLLPPLIFLTYPPPLSPSQFSTSSTLLRLSFFSFFFFFLSLFLSLFLSPSFPLPVFPSVVNPQGLRGI